jgi:hypothetical protein
MIIWTNRTEQPPPPPPHPPLLSVGPQILSDPMGGGQSGLLHSIEYFVKAQER